MAFPHNTSAKFHIRPYGSTEATVNSLPGTGARVLAQFNFTTVNFPLTCFNFGPYLEAPDNSGNYRKTISHEYRSGNISNA